jgi:hypothetical protein
LIDEYKPGTGRLSFRSVSGDARSLATLEIQIPKLSFTSFENKPPVHKSASCLTPVAKRVDRIMDGTVKRSVEEWNIEFSGLCKNVILALSEQFTAGLSRTRFVVWWHAAAKKFVPGLYCPDIVTALYALAMWSSGTSGGWAICQKCNKDYPRSRAKQLYCSHRCQVAAAMKRMRDKQKRKSETESKASAKSKKLRGRK